MEKEKISITTVPVTIKLMEVGGKKMTLSVFKQIPEKWFGSDDFTDEERQSSFIGTVKHNNKIYIIFYRNGVLYKDAFEKAEINDEVRISLSKCNRALQAHPDLDWVRSNYATAIKKYQDEEKVAKEINQPYMPFLKDEYQIYIAI